MNKIVGIAGSHRLKGNSEIVLEKVLEYIQGDEKSDISSDLITLADKNISSCIACDKCRKLKKCSIKDDFQSIYSVVEKADVIIFACPVYNFSPPSKLLNFRTRLSRIAHCRGEKSEYSSSEHFISKYPHSSALKRKIGGSIVVARRGGTDSVLAQMNSFFLIHQMFIVGSGYLNILYGYHAGEALDDHEGMRNVKLFADNCRWLLKKITSSDSDNNNYDKNSK